jgi:hypothetical protein
MPLTGPSRTFAIGCEPAGQRHGLGFGTDRTLQRPPSPPGAPAGTAGSISRSRPSSVGIGDVCTGGTARRPAPRALPTSYMNEFLHPTRQGSFLDPKVRGGRTWFESPWPKAGKHLSNILPYAIDELRRKASLFQDLQVAFHYLQC